MSWSFSLAKEVVEVIDVEEVVVVAVSVADEDEWDFIRYHNAS